MDFSIRISVGNFSFRYISFMVRRKRVKRSNIGMEAFRIFFKMFNSKVTESADISQWDHFIYICGKI